MNLSHDLTMARRWGLILVVAFLAVLSSSFTSSDGVHTAIDATSKDRKRLIGSKLTIDRGIGPNTMRGSRQSNSTPAVTTPTPEPEATSQASAEDDASGSIETQPSEDTGDIIRRRVFTTIAIAAAVTACLLLLLWAYVTLADPLRRRRAAMKIRQMRREERRSRLRRRPRQ